MSERDAILRTILENPDDDTPRLVFADWLQDEGDFDRAEVIRLQCEMARGISNPARQRDAEARVAEILSVRRAEWLNELPTWEGIRWEMLERGFFEGVRADHPDAFFDHMESIFRAAPIRRLSFHRFAAKDARQLARNPRLAHIQAIDFEDGNRIENAGVEALAHSEFATGLRELKLRLNDIGPAGVGAIAGSPALAQLQKLDLDRNALFDDGIVRLADSKRLTSLKYLSLGWTLLGTDGIAAIARSPIVEKLVWLYLASNQIEPAGAQALAASTGLRQLKALYLDYNRIGNEGAIAIADSPIAESLKWLYLRRNGIGERGAAALADSPFLNNIAELIVGENPIGAEAAAKLKARFGDRVQLH